MAEPAPIRCQIQFGPFAADLRSRELSKYGIHIKIQDRPFEILAMLLEHPGDVVTREEMRARLWPDGTFVDFDNNISSAIGKLRAALSDSAAAPRYIETVGHGYRLAAEVTLVSAPVNTSARSTAETAVLPTTLRVLVGRASSRSAKRWGVVVTAVALLIALAGWTAYRRWASSHAWSQPAPSRMTLAVLPFANLTGDSAQEYLSDGLTEEMITQLGRLEPAHLAVIARTSVMRYKGLPVPLGQIGAELGVQYVLEGSVRRDAATLRITAQLIRVQDQTHVWARAYDREPKDLLSVQAEIAQEIGDEIQVALGGGVHPKTVAAQPALSQKQYQAYDLYLKGTYFFAKRTATDLQKALAYFQQSIASNPEDARAYAALADCYTLLRGYSAVADANVADRARAAALRALQIDERLPEAHTALALIVQNFDWDWEAAEREFRRAIELAPNYATAHHWYAEHLMWRGRFDEALQESEKARRLDPLSLIIAADNGVILYYSRQYDRAIGQFRSVLDLDPHFTRAHMIAYAYVQIRAYTQALADLEQERPRSPIGDGWYWAQYAYFNGRAGHMSQARAGLEQLGRLRRTQTLDPAVFVWANLAMNNNEAALDWLEKAYAQHSNVIATLKVEPAFDPLRNHPHFQDLLRRAHLDQ